VPAGGGAAVPAGGRAAVPAGGGAAEVRQRILEATYACVARWGLSKTTVEDAARQAGLSRATVYRYFPGGRNELMGAVVAWEHARFFTRLYEEVQSAASLEEVMERGLAFAHRAIEEHEVLQRVLETEPELLLPTLTVEATGTQRLIAAFLTPYLERHPMAPGIDVEEAADFLARMALSFISSPGRWDLDDPGQVARLVRAELLGGIVPPAAS
jgi:AcrR family transcriptional regulator